jgi:two-component system, OmpR family, sensor histidine kinase BaeS
MGLPRIGGTRRLYGTGRGNRTIFGIGQLGRRLALVFVAVALAAIAVNATIAAESLGSDINSIAQKEERTLTQSVAVMAASAYQGGTWAHADLAPAFRRAMRGDAAAQIHDKSGHVVGQSSRFKKEPVAHERVVPLKLGQDRIGSLTVRFSAESPGAVVRSFEADKWRTRLLAASIAALIALVVSLIVTRAITGPLEQLLAAVRCRGIGKRSAVIKPVRGTGVIRELIESFNESAVALDKQDRLRRNLVADVAHELRTPVAVLQASLEAMQDGVAEVTPDGVASLRDEVLRLANMVEDLQRLAAAESASLQLRLEPHDLAAVAAEAENSLSDAFRVADVRLEQRLTEVHVLCDRVRMREVISNLLTNSLKFTPPGGAVSLQVGPDGSGMATLSVNDTGVGIPGEELPHVTERFFRGVRSSDMAAGSGIGLTIVAELVEAHNGQLDIASEPGTGTRVTVTLPLAAAESRRLALVRSGAGQYR